MIQSNIFYFLGVCTLTTETIKACYQFLITVNLDSLVLDRVLHGIMCNTHDANLSGLVLPLPYAMYVTPFSFISSFIVSSTIPEDMNFHHINVPGLDAAGSLTLNVVGMDCCI